MNLVKGRCNTAVGIHDELMQYFHERIVMEEAYVQALQKLYRRAPIEGLTSMSGFNAAWEEVKLAASKTAHAHQLYARRLGAEIETPIRKFAGENTEWQQLASMQDNMSGIARDFGAAEGKVEKYKRRGTKAKGEKVANAENNIQQSQQSWVSEAPFIFEKFENADLARLNFLKDIFVQCITLEMDTANACVQGSESTLNSLLSISSEDEAQKFADRHSTGGPPPVPFKTAAASSRPNSMLQSSSTMPYQQSQPLSTPSRSRTTQEADQKGEHSVKKSKLGSLLRVGRGSGKREKLPNTPPRLSSPATSFASSALDRQTSPASPTDRRGSVPAATYDAQGNAQSVGPDFFRSLQEPLKASSSSGQPRPPSPPKTQIANGSNIMDKPMESPAEYNTE